MCASHTRRVGDNKTILQLKKFAEVLLTGLSFLKIYLKYFKNNAITTQRFKEGKDLLKARLPSQRGGLTSEICFTPKYVFLGGNPGQLYRENLGRQMGRTENTLQVKGRVGWTKPHQSMLVSNTAKGLRELVRTECSLSQ